MPLDPTSPMQANHHQQQPAMGFKGGPPSWKASLRYGTGAAGSSSGSSCTVWPEAKVDNKKPAARARKPKRTSFECLECSKTFPTQQAMAGHCSAHTRAGARTRRPPGYTNHLPAAAPVSVVPAAAPSNPLPLPLPPQHHHNVNAIQCWCPQVQVSPSTIPMPVRYVPYARPTSNQMMVRQPYLDPRGRRVSRRTLDPRTNYPAFRPAAGPMPNVPVAGRLGWTAFVPIYSVPPPFNMHGAPPSDAASSTARRGRTRADVTLRLGSGREHAQTRTLPLLEPLMVSDGHRQQGAGRERKLVTADGGGDQGRNKAKDQNQMAGLDLELRLYR
ncbi:unnamed protein product [Alopecurus aequalis]